MTKKTKHLRQFLPVLFLVIRLHDPQPYHLYLWFRPKKTRVVRSPLLAYPEKLALCRWGIRDGLYIISLLGFTVVLPNLQRDLGLIFWGVRDRLMNASIVVLPKNSGLKPLHLWRKKKKIPFRQSFYYRRGNY